MVVNFLKEELFMKAILKSIIISAMFLFGSCVHAQEAELNKLLNKVVARDSKSWFFNKYDYGSMTDSRVLRGSIKNGTLVVKAYYTYNGGSGGWVEAEIDEDGVQCLRYWDFPSACRPPK